MTGSAEQKAAFFSAVPLKRGALPAEIAVSILAEVVRAIRVEGLATPARNAATAHVSREEACHGHG